MPQICYICGKHSQTGNKVSHSNIKTKRQWRPNIRRVKAVVDGTVRHIRVCAKCLKAGKVKRAI
ncbi:MAG TPA: 50S ribosomal protein L28 [Firmicutes bacterium]|nr:50S ribosomal protein L28 [Bacillota bacterium]HHY98888.1 50S ribosomal protein L28 [Bacillota bacterium]